MPGSALSEMVGRLYLALVASRADADLVAILQAAIISFYYPVTWIFPTLILAGGLATLVIKYKEVIFV